jgi:hypothetical protein
VVGDRTVLLVEDEHGDLRSCVQHDLEFAPLAGRQDQLLRMPVDLVVLAQDQ